MIRRNKPSMLNFTIFRWPSSKHKTLIVFSGVKIGKFHGWIESGKKITLLV